MLAGILTGREDAIAERWTELVFGTYPRETTRLLGGEHDPFANPVGQMCRDAAKPLIRALSEDRINQECLDSLGTLMRLRSVQDLTASQAVSIIPLLRTAVLEEGGKSLDYGALFDLVGRVERLTMIAFDVFVGCREKIFEVRALEAGRLQASLLRRAEQVLASKGHDATAMASLDGSNGLSTKGGLSP